MSPSLGVLWNRNFFPPPTFEIAFLLQTSVTTRFQLSQLSKARLWWFYERHPKHPDSNRQWNLYCKPRSPKWHSYVNFTFFLNTTWFYPVSHFQRCIYWGLPWINATHFNDFRKSALISSQLKLGISNKHSILMRPKGSIAPLETKCLEDLHQL